MAEVKQFSKSRPGGVGIKQWDRAQGWCQSLFLLLCLAGPTIVESKTESLALLPGSDSLQSWLVPSVPEDLKVYAFHVSNPEEVQHGGKPVLEEVGPFVYRSVTVKNSVEQDSGKENLQYNEDGETLTYRPRKFYFLDREQSVGDPGTAFITVPNIPLLTWFSNLRDSGWDKSVKIDILEQHGLGTPFINVSVNALLWGDQYPDDLPCMSLVKPCDETDLTAEDDWSDWKRKKRETRQQNKPTKHENLRNMDFDLMSQPKQEYVGCECQWGLFRDRNVTLRKPLKINHGMANPSQRGWIKEFNSATTLNWWKPGSKCDQVGGQDSSTLPPDLKRTESIDMFVRSMYRRIKLHYEKDTEHLGLTSYRFIPPPNSMGSHTDPDSNKRNSENWCFCKREKEFTCFKSGVLNLEPVLPVTYGPNGHGQPFAISFPHFYEADQAFLDAVDGLQPSKERHQFYVDVHPESGLPLAFRSRYQLNTIIRKDTDIDTMRNFKDELILPLLWFEDGFSEPSAEMATKLKEPIAASVPLAGVGNQLDMSLAFL